MGNSCCKLDIEDNEDVKQLKRPTWKSDKPLTEADVLRMREEFWDTEPHYGGDRVIWDALKAACEADLDTAKVILDSAGIIVANDTMTVCYDERGRRYVLPKYVLQYPTNVIHNRSGDITTNGSRDNTRNNDLSPTRGDGIAGFEGPQVQLATRQ